MPRPKSTTPKVKVHVSLPQEVLARILLQIASPDHTYGFPQGALSTFIQAAIEEKLTALEAKYVNPQSMP